MTWHLEEVVLTLSFMLSAFSLQIMSLTSGFVRSLNSMYVCVFPELMSGNLMAVKHAPICRSLPLYQGRWGNFIAIICSNWTLQEKNGKLPF